MTNYKNLMTKNTLMTILDKIRASKFFWLMIYERSSEKMEQKMDIKKHDISCFDNRIALKNT